MAKNKFVTGGLLILVGLVAFSSVAYAAWVEFEDRLVIVQDTRIATSASEIVFAATKSSSTPAIYTEVDPVTVITSDHILGKGVTNVLGAGPSEAYLWYDIEIPEVLHGSTSTLRSFNFFYDLTGSGYIDSWRLYVHDISSGTATNIASTDVDITSGTQRSASLSLPYTFTSDDKLHFAIELNAGETSTSTAVYRGSVANWDTDE